SLGPLPHGPLTVLGLPVGLLALLPVGVLAHLPLGLLHYTFRLAHLGDKGHELGVDARAVRQPVEAVLDLSLPVALGRLAGLFLLGAAGILLGAALGGLPLCGLAASACLVLGELPLRLGPLGGGEVERELPLMHPRLGLAGILLGAAGLLLLPLPLGLPVGLGLP